MIIKKFQGKTEAEAVENAKKELGNSVVIMNVRNVKRKGLLNFVMPQIIEVTVALEDEPEKVRQPKVETPLPAPQVPVDTMVQREVARRFQPAPGNILKEDEENRADSSAIEEKLESLHILLEQQLQKPEEPGADDGEEEESELARFIKLLYNTMLENEVSEQYANQIIDEIEKMNKPNVPIDYALANVYQKMILKFGKPIEITPAAKGPKVLFFVGPTGVGKTTTIAKIASEFCVGERKKIVLLTADTYRIAAAEQLRTYAGILEVPFRIIYSEDEMEQALCDFKDYDYIMVDTAGHSHQNKEQGEAMGRFIHSVDELAEKDVFLVLSAVTKYNDLVSIADAYTEMTEYKLIFTKLDETSNLGNLLNIKLHTGGPLSYVTYGQNVPDDIENFNPQKTVKLLLGGGRN